MGQTTDPLVVMKNLINKGHNVERAFILAQAWRGIWYAEIEKSYKPDWDDAHDRLMKIREDLEYACDRVPSLPRHEIDNIKRPGSYIDIHSKDRVIGLFWDAWIEEKDKVE